MSNSSSSSAFSDLGYTDDYHLNSKIMIIAISVLFLVVFFIICLHIYAKWFWRRSFTVTHGIALHNALNHNNNANGGLDKASIDKLPVFVYKAPEKDSAAAGNNNSRSVHVLECAVCLSEFQENDHGRLLPACNHCFHTQCIDMWFFSHSTCPLCRKEVMPPPSASDAPSPSSASETSSPFPSTSASSSPTSDAHQEAPQDMPPNTEPLSSEADNGTSISYPSNVLFWGNQPQVSSQRHPSSSSDSSSSYPPSGQSHITVDIPNSSSKAPEEDVSTSPNASDPTPSLKYPGFRNSIKRILSRQSSRVLDRSTENPKDAV